MVVLYCKKAITSIKETIMAHFVPVKLTGFAYIAVGLVLFVLNVNLSYDDYFRRRDWIDALLLCVASLVPTLLTFHNPLNPVSS